MTEKGFRSRKAILDFRKSACLFMQCYIFSKFTGPNKISQDVSCGFRKVCSSPYPVNLPVNYAIILISVLHLPCYPGHCILAHTLSWRCRFTLSGPPIFSLERCILHYLRWESLFISQQESPDWMPRWIYLKLLMKHGRNYAGYLQGLKKSQIWKQIFKALKSLKFWSKVLKKS